MVLEGLRKAFLKRKLKKVRGKERENYLREINKIESKQMYEAKVKSIQNKAFQEEQLKQAAELGRAKAKIRAEQQIKALKASGGKSGFLAGFDKFLAGTGVAKGSAPVLRKESGVGGFGGGTGFNIIGGGISQPRVDIVGSSGYSVVGGAPLARPAPKKKKKRKSKYIRVRIR